MWRRIKERDKPSVGDVMVLASTSFGGTVKSNCNRVDCEVVESTDHLFTVEANGHKYQFEQGTWIPIAIRPKYHVFPSREVMDETFEAAALKSKISVAFNFTREDRQDFTLDQLRSAASALGLVDD